MHDDDLQELMGAFTAEAEEFLNTLESQLLQLETQTDASEAMQGIKALFRAAHSLKGSALMFGFTELADASHCLEDSFGILRDRLEQKMDEGFELDPNTYTVLLQGVDYLKAVAHSENIDSSGIADQHFKLEALIQLKQELTLDAQHVMPDMSKMMAGMDESLIRNVIVHELPGVLEKIEILLHNLSPETLSVDIASLVNLQGQLSSTAAMFQIPDLGVFAQDWKTLLIQSNLSVDGLRSQGTPLLCALVEYRQRVVSGESISVSPSPMEAQGTEMVSAESQEMSFDLGESNLLDFDAILDEAMGLAVEPLKTLSAQTSEIELAKFSDYFADRVDDFDDVLDSIINDAVEMETDSVLPTGCDVMPSQPVVLAVESLNFELETSELETSELETSVPSTSTPIPDDTIVNEPTQERRTIRVDLEELNDLINLVGELVINRTQLELQAEGLQSETRQMVTQIGHLRHSGGALRYEYDRLSMPQLQTTHGDFDALEFDHYSDFHLTAQSMLENSQDLNISAKKVEDVARELENGLGQLQLITQQLRNKVMQLRVVPFRRVIDHLPRAIRDLSQKHHKNVELSLLGRETKIDESILDALRSPLMHLVRNAFDHGLESTEERELLGKPSQGRITIEARHQGGQTLISIQDDGRGIDPEKIRQHLITKKLATPVEANRYNLNELYESMFLPGFSTAQNITELSGRGVGLDVVKENLNQVRGSIKVESTLGIGTSFIIKLPLMLSIVPANLVKVGEDILAIPQDAVEEILQIEPQKMQAVGEQSVIKWRDIYLPVLSLSQLLQYNKPTQSQTEESLHTVVILQSNDRVIALKVDGLAGQQEIVIKTYPSILPKPFGIAGSTLLGAGDVILIIDIEDIFSRLDSPNLDESTLSFTGEIQDIRPTSGPAPQILVVDDSYTIRLLVTKVLKRAGYRIVEAKDGQEAIDKLEAGLDCQFVLTDLEMPRVDGFGVLKAVKSNPQLCQLPIAVLTSRTGPKHRKMAEDLGADVYLTKPYKEDELLAVIAKYTKLSRL